MRKFIEKSLYIETTKDERTLRILLPEDYDTSEKRYPVLYMHDGQNLFDDKTSYAGQSWKIQETLDDLCSKAIIDDLIVVGIDNSNLRFFEYSPWKGANDIKKMTNLDIGGLGDVYADFVVNHVKPMVDQFYRTNPDYSNTMIAGSSMGAYISCYIAVKYPNVFKNIGVFSLASWFNEKDFLNFMNQQQIDPKQRYFISIGRDETSDEDTPYFNLLYLENSRNLLNLLKEKGLQDILYIETDDKHNELAWSKVFVDFIRFANKKS